MTSEDADQGRELVSTGKLRDLRLELGLTLVAMSNFIDISVITYRKWETHPEVRLWDTTASRLGRFYRAAQRQLQILSDQGVKLSELTPFYEVAGMWGMTQEGLLNMYRAGELSQAVDLGVLGLWLPKDDV